MNDPQKDAPEQGGQDDTADETAVLPVADSTSTRPLGVEDLFGSEASPDDATREQERVPAPEVPSDAAVPLDVAASAGPPYAAPVHDGPVQGAPVPTEQAPAAAVPKNAPGVPERPRGVVVSTLVWGLVVMIVGIGALALVLGARFDLQLALIIVLGGAGLALVGGSVAAAARARRAR